MNQTIVRELHVALTKEELDARRKELGEIEYRAMEVRLEKRQKTREFNELLSELDTRSKELAQISVSETEVRSVKCVWSIDGTQKVLTRMDTGEELERVEMTAAERQTTMLVMENEVQEKPEPPAELPPDVPSLPEIRDAKLEQHNQSEQEILAALERIQAEVPRNSDKVWLKSAKLATVKDDKVSLTKSGKAELERLRAKFGSTAEEQPVPLVEPSKDVSRLLGYVKAGELAKLLSEDKEKLLQLGLAEVDETTEEFRLSEVGNLTFARFGAVPKQRRSRRAGGSST